MTQIPLNFDAPLPTPEKPAVKLETLSTQELRKLYQENTGRDSKLRFLMATEDVLRTILIEGIESKEAAEHRLRAIESGHPHAGISTTWSW